MADKKKQKTGPTRLDKFLGEMGYGTRTQIKEMVRKGRVQVNGQVIKAPESKLAPETDQVMVDQALVGYARKMCIRDRCTTAHSMCTRLRLVHLRILRNPLLYHPLLFCAVYDEHDQCM